MKAFVEKRGHDARPTSASSASTARACCIARRSRGKIGATRQLGDGKLMHDDARRAGRLRFPLRRRARPAGRARRSPRSITRRCCARSAPAPRPRCSISAASPTSPGGTARTGSIAFDAGPANAPINDWIKAHGLGEMDVDGALAASGTVDEERLAELLEHSYLTAPYPKSLDRFGFTHEMAEGLDAGRWRRDAGGVHRGGGGQGARPAAAAADEDHRLRRRAAEPDDHGDARRARRRRGGARRGRRLARRCGRGGAASRSSRCARCAACRSASRRPPACRSR